MQNYTRTFETPEGAMNFMSIDNKARIFNHFITRTYYNGGVVTQNTKLDTGDTMVKACYYCGAREVFVVDVEIIK